MIGSFKVSVKNSKNSYEFVLKRNITILTGNSGSGKTTLYDMIWDYNRFGKQSGVKLVCDKNVVALGKDDWERRITEIEDSIIVIDEEDFIKSYDFARVVQNSSNYFLLITRFYLQGLPYSVDEVYEISGNKKKSFRPLYKDIEKMYHDPAKRELPFEPEVIITEDSKSGFQFFKKITSGTDVLCVTADGKSNIYKCLNAYEDKKVLIIADGAAFGSEMGDLVKRQKLGFQKIGIFLPESFEWLILKSGLVCLPDMDEIQSPELFVDSKDFLSWEQYFTKLLETLSQNPEYKLYKKKELAEYYLHDKSIVQVMDLIKGWKLP